MSKYSSSAHQRAAPPRNRMPPAIRGIGCLLMVIVPIFSWALADYLISGPARSWGLPPSWFQRPQLPALMLKLEGLARINSFLQAQQALTGKIVIALCIIIVLGAVMSIIYGYIYKMFGPSQYGPQDVPPPHIRTKKYKR